ncbi:MAG: Rne/Rng family ribonuclease [Prolixibacteraceae bacterium]|nr:Rne/Rng family ribonuclease [Prolixibacteraceae bacterium]MBT6006019.1 Rne/Rng family ribonuclease [Prolixibacteraceae bacterium]MBT6766558.1 Rne/Rng family ribonuclease [Prolixibacteraceae bacterium]MBT6997372.1 Rne/Rng family ribonuclease [Prolixibacteraceae bacterium]MBT7394410.1 Rne/Rng family ribonuclease [Prolixibacteraceae bacterium]
MSSDLIIDVTPSEIVIALQENKKIVEFTRVRSGAKFAVGDIYLGKVKKIMPSLNAAFIDVGYEKDAFLHYLDMGPQFATLNKFLRITSSRKNKISSISRIHSEPDINKEGKVNEILKIGQKILVQVAKEPISTKGPRLTSEISIAGRFLVLLPFSDKVSISQKIKTNEEKNRLKKLIQSIKPRKYGVIVRTVAEGKRVAELDKELRRLVDKWETTFNKLSRVNAPSLIIGEIDRTTALLRDIYHPKFNSIIVNDHSVSNELSEYISSIQPDKKKIVKFYSGRQPIFEYFGIEKQIKASFGKTVSFKEGAYLIVEHTEAFHVIDVNSGNRAKAGLDQETNALDVNMAACDEIARQLRLRDMGGIIVIDFIDMHIAANRQKVYEYMKEIMAADRTKHNILPLSKFCLMQITRQRVRPEENIETAEKCPTCKGSGNIVPTILFADDLDGKVKYILKDLNKKKLSLKVHPYLAAYLTKGLKSYRNKWFFKYFRWVKVDANNSYSYLEYHFFDENLEEIIL